MAKRVRYGERYLSTVGKKCVSLFLALLLVLSLTPTLAFANEEILDEPLLAEEIAPEITEPEKVDSPEITEPEQVILDVTEDDLVILEAPVIASFGLEQIGTELLPLDVNSETYVTYHRNYPADYEPNDTVQRIWYLGVEEGTTVATNDLFELGWTVPENGAFLGWSTSPVGEVISSFSAGNVTNLYAQYVYTNPTAVYIDVSNQQSSTAGNGYFDVTWADYDFYAFAIYTKKVIPGQPIGVLPICTINPDYSGMFTFNGWTLNGTPVTDENYIIPAGFTGGSLDPTIIPEPFLTVTYHRNYDIDDTNKKVFSRSSETAVFDNPSGRENSCDWTAPTDSTFVGWSTNPAASTPEYGEYVKLPQLSDIKSLTMDLYAVYSAVNPDLCEISFDLGVATGFVTLPENPMELVQGQSFGRNMPLANPMSSYSISGKDYRFVGWYFDDAFTQIATDNSLVPLTATSTLYAKWEEIHKLTFDFGTGGTFFGTGSYYAVEGSTIINIGSNNQQLPIRPATQTAWFDGWTLNGKQIGDNYIFEAGDWSYPITANWTFSKNYTGKIIYSFGSETITQTLTDSFSYGQAVTDFSLTQADASSFIASSSIPSGYELSTTEIFPKTIPVGGSITIPLAEIIPDITVTFDDGINPRIDIILPYNTPFGSVFPADPAPVADRTFLGWFDGNTKLTSSSLVNHKQNYTVEGKWEIHDYSIITDFPDYTGSGDVTARLDAPYSEFQKLIYLGTGENPVEVIVDPSNYTVREGSTIIILSEQYLKSLGEGKHNFRAEFTSGQVDGISVTVTKPDVSSNSGTTPATGSYGMPSTGDSVASILCVTVIAVLGFILVGFALGSHHRPHKSTRKY